MEQNHNTKQLYDSDPNLLPLTKWECIHENSNNSTFPMTCGHRGQVVNNHLIIFGGFCGVYTKATYRLNLGK